MENNTVFLQNLSSALQSVLTGSRTAEFLNTTNELLSTVQELSGVSPFVEINTLVNSLTSIPLHPYQNLLWRHFEPEYKFKTIESVSEPEHLPIKECINYITNKEQEISKTIFHNLTCCPEHQLNSYFEFISGNEVICNIQKQKNYLEFFEMVRQIPINSVTPENSDILVKKIVAEYIKVI